MPQAQSEDKLVIAGKEYGSRLIIGTGTVSYTHLTLPTILLV